MVGARKNTQAKTSVRQSGPTAAKATTSKKRKSTEAEIVDLTGEDVDSAASAQPDAKKGRESTPPPKESNEPATERTPGRDGPIKRDDHSLPNPVIKPFKGPKGSKVRKTAAEKEEEYSQYARDNESHSFHELHVCYDKGPNGSPTYDKSGFQLSYKKVAEWMRPKAYNKASMVNGMERRLEKDRQEEEQMKTLFFEKGEAPESTPGGDGKMAWKDRVSKDLNVPWHKVGVKEFEQWDKMGFKKARKGEYENFTDVERKRFLRLLSGASLRK